jgi:ribonuclease E
LVAEENKTVSIQESTPVTQQESIIQTPPSSMVINTPKPEPVVLTVKALPQVVPTILDRSSLDEVLNQVGLIWVDTNPVKHEEVLAQIAAEPKPIHVPRVIKPLAELPSGPMILVETGGQERAIELQ